MTSSLIPEESLDFVDENEEWAKVSKLFNCWGCHSMFVVIQCFFDMFVLSNIF